MRHIITYIKFNESNHDNLIDEMITYFKKQFLKANCSIKYTIKESESVFHYTYTIPYKNEIYNLTTVTMDRSSHRFYMLNDESIDNVLGNQLTSIIHKIYDNTNNILRWIWRNMDSDSPEVQKDFSQLRDDFCERCDEFGIIKNGKIDMISLNQLYDFYNAPFDEEKIEIELSMRNFI